MIPISPAIEQRVVLLFPPDEQERVRTLLVEECGENIPRLRMAGPELLRIGVLKLSEGRLDKLQHAIDLAKRDLRDVLVWAGHGGSPPLRDWLPEQKWSP